MKKVSKTIHTYQCSLFQLKNVVKLTGEFNKNIKFTYTLQER